MVLLKRIYSEPAGLFDTVEFTNGINIIYGEKSIDSKQQESLNYIGKSTLLDLVNFCMLSAIPQRLKSARYFLDEYAIVLEITVNGIDYCINRSTSKASEAYFGEVLGKKYKYKINELKRELCDLFFKDYKYKGYYSNDWYRKLIPLFAKIQQKGKNIFKIQ